MDTISKSERSALMSRVRSCGNRSTEKRLRSALARNKIRGWRMQAREFLGRPDFVFDREQILVFVDGCFWHGCPTCYRRPKSRKKYWDAKVNGNISRDKRLRSSLRRAGWSVMRIWEHELVEPSNAIERIKLKLKNRTVTR